MQYIKTAIPPRRTLRWLKKSSPATDVVNHELSPMEAVKVEEETEIEILGQAKVSNPNTVCDSTEGVGFSSKSVNEEVVLENCDVNEPRNEDDEPEIGTNQVEIDGQLEDLGRGSENGVFPIHDPQLKMVADSNHTTMSSGRQNRFTPQPSDNTFRLNTTTATNIPASFFSPTQFSYKGLLHSNIPYHHRLSSPQQFTKQPQYIPIQLPPKSTQQPSIPTQQPPIPTQLSFDDNDDDEVIPEAQPQQLKTQLGKSSKFKGRAKPIPWTTEEEVALIKSWIDISEHNIGNPQKGSFWNRVLKQFHEIMNKGEYRTADQLSSKYKDLNHKISKFSGIYNNVANNMQSGTSEADILQEALIRYRNENHGTPFGHGAAWNLLKKTPKWGPIAPMDLPSRPSKRSKSSPCNEHDRSSDTHDGGFNINDEGDDDDNEPFHVQEPQRPPDRYKGKQPVSSLNIGASAEDVSHYLNSLDAFNARGEKYILYLTKKLEIRERELMLREEEKKQRDLEFLITSHDHLSGSVLRTVLARKEEIKKKYGWKCDD